MKADCTQVLSFIYYKLPHQTAPPPPPKPFILFQKLLWAEQYPECYQTSFFSPTGISTPGCSGRCRTPSSVLGEALWFDGSRAQGWEVLGGTAGEDVRQRSPSSPSSVHSHSCSTSPHLLRLSTTLTWHPEWCFYSSFVEDGERHK